MSLFSVSSPSLDDVVFEGRNQAYGAYQLRQDYKQHLASAGGITIGMCALLMLSWVAWQQLAPAKVATLAPIKPMELETTVIKLKDVKEVVIAPPKPARALAAPAAHQAAPSTPTVVKDIVAQPTATFKPTPADAVVDGPVGPTTTGAPNGQAETGPATEPAVSGPYIAVERMPEFAGGQAALLRYLQKHLRYPSAALAAQAEGRVFMSFVVQADGTIADVTILKGLGYGLDEEAQRVVKQMPAWTPGYQSKHAVPVRFTLPITFKFQ